MKDQKIKKDFERFIELEGEDNIFYRNHFLLENPKKKEIINENDFLEAYTKKYNFQYSFEDTNNKNLVKNYQINLDKDEHYISKNYLKKKMEKEMEEKEKRDRKKELEQNLSYHNMYADRLSTVYRPLYTVHRLCTVYRPYIDRL